jgi:hypothetical protein
MPIGYNEGRFFCCAERYSVPAYMNCNQGAYPSIGAFSGAGMASLLFGLAL